MEISVLARFSGALHIIFEVRHAFSFAAADSSQYPSRVKICEGMCCAWGRQQPL